MGEDASKRSHSEAERSDDSDGGNTGLVSAGKKGGARRAMNGKARRKMMKKTHGDADNHYPAPSYTPTDGNGVPNIAALAFDPDERDRPAVSSHYDKPPSRTLAPSTVANHNNIECEKHDKSDEISRDDAACAGLLVQSTVADAQIVESGSQNTGIRATAQLGDTQMQLTVAQGNILRLEKNNIALTYNLEISRLHAVECLRTIRDRGVVIADQGWQLGRFNELLASKDELLLQRTADMWQSENDLEDLQARNQALFQVLCDRTGVSLGQLRTLYSDVLRDLLVRKDQKLTNIVVLLKHNKVIIWRMQQEAERDLDDELRRNHSLRGVIAEKDRTLKQLSEKHSSELAQLQSVYDNSAYSPREAPGLIVADQVIHKQCDMICGLQGDLQSSQNEVAALKDQLAAKEAETERLKEQLAAKDAENEWLTEASGKLVDDVAAERSNVKILTETSTNAALVHGYIQENAHLKSLKGDAEQRAANCEATLDAWADKHNGRLVNWSKKRTKLENETQNLKNENKELKKGLQGHPADLISELSREVSKRTRVLGRFVKQHEQMERQHEQTKMMLRHNMNLQAAGTQQDKERISALERELNELKRKHGEPLAPGNY